MNRRLSLLLQEARQKSGLTQEEVASRIGLKKNTLSNYEHGVSEPSLDTLVALFCIYDLDPGYVFSVTYGTPLRDGSLTPVEEDLIHLFRQLDSHGRNMVQETARLEAEHITKQRAFWQEKVSRIAARGGGVLSVDQQEQDEIAALYAYLKEEDRL